MFLLELWPSCLVKSSRSPRFILTCFAKYSSLSNRTKVLYPVPHHNFISPRGGTHSTRPPWLVCAPDQNCHAAQVTSSSSFVIVCSAGRERHGSIRHGIITRNKLMVQRDLQRVLFQENPRFSLPLRNGMRRLIEIFLLYILCSLTKISV